MKHPLLLFFLAVLLGCSTATKNEKRLTEFKEPNFGVTFRHSEDVRTEYNPHGGADRILLFRKGKSFGGLRIRPPFPSGDESRFVELMKEQHYKERLNASVVEHRLFDNPHRHQFHAFKAKLTRDGTEYITESFIHHLRRTAKDEHRAALDRMFGIFQFDFIAPAKDYPALAEDIKTIIDTFRLKEEP